MSTITGHSVKVPLAKDYSHVSVWPASYTPSAEMHAHSLTCTSKVMSPSHANCDVSSYPVRQRPMCFRSMSRYKSVTVCGTDTSERSASPPRPLARSQPNLAWPMRIVIGGNTQSLLLWKICGGSKKLSKPHIETQLALWVTWFTLSPPSGLEEVPVWCRRLLFGPLEGGVDPPPETRLQPWRGDEGWFGKCD